MSESVSELPRPKKYSVASGDPKCVRCGLSATKGYEGRTDFLDFCDGCFRMFERWLNGDDDPEIRPDGGYITCEGCGRNPTRLRKSAWCSQCPEAGGPNLVTDGGTIPEPQGLALRVYNGHKLKPIPYKQSGHGPGPKAWECVGCGRERKEKIAFNKTPCPDPILWVRVGCPGDGLRVCRDCEAVYVGDYKRGPFYERTCIECGSIEVYRDDDPDVEPGLIQASHDGTRRPLHTGRDRQEGEAR